MLELQRNLISFSIFHVKLLWCHRKENYKIFQNFFYFLRDEGENFFYFS